MDAMDMAARIRLALIETASEAYEDAGVQGLCAEGRWEAAVGATRSAVGGKPRASPCAPSG